LTWKLSPDLLGALNSKEYFETANPAWEKVLGWTEEEVVSKSIFDLLHPEDLEHTRAGFELTQVGQPRPGSPTGIAARTAAIDGFHGLAFLRRDMSIVPAETSEQSVRRKSNCARVFADGSRTVVSCRKNALTIPPLSRRVRLCASAALGRCTSFEERCYLEDYPICLRSSAEPVAYVTSKKATHPKVARLTPRLEGEYPTFAH
jgi:hypothetical protein